MYSQRHIFSNPYEFSSHCVTQPVANDDGDKKESDLAFPTSSTFGDEKNESDLAFGGSTTTFGDGQEQTSSSLSFPTGENDTKTDKESFSMGGLAFPSGNTFVFP